MNFFLTQSNRFLIIISSFALHSIITFCLVNAICKLLQEYKITTSFSENLGTFLINTTAQFNGNQESCTDTVPIPTHVCISESSQSIGLQADRIPLIEKTHEYHVI